MEGKPTDREFLLQLTGRIRAMKTAPAVLGLPELPEWMARDLAETERQIMNHLGMEEPHD